MVEHLKQFTAAKRKVVTPANRGRAEDVKFYQSPRWRKLRAMVLHREPLCAVCRKSPAIEVHHIKARKLFPALAFEIENLQGVCVPCHRRIEGRGA